MRTTFTDQLSAIQSRYDGLMDSYDYFEKLLEQTQPFVPRYVRQVSRQSSRNLHGFGGNYSS